MNFATLVLIFQLSIGTNLVFMVAENKLTVLESI